MQYLHLMYQKIENIQKIPIFSKFNNWLKSPLQEIGDKKP